MGCDCCSHLCHYHFRRFSLSFLSSLFHFVRRTFRVVWITWKLSKSVEHFSSPYVNESPLISASKRENRSQTLHILFWRVSLTGSNESVVKGDITRQHPVFVFPWDSKCRCLSKYIIELLFHSIFYHPFFFILVQCLFICFVPFRVSFFVLHLIFTTVFTSSIIEFYICIY